jgi:hypothetical protein
MQRQSMNNSLLRDSRRDSWIMTMPTTYFVAEIGRDEVLRRCDPLRYSRVKRRFHGARRRGLDALAAWACIVATLGVVYVGLGWVVEAALSALQIVR